MNSESVIEIRRGGGDTDATVILELLDGAVAWLAAAGRTGQWGTTPASENPRFVDHAKRFAGGDGLYIAGLGGTPVGALCVGEAHDYVPAATEPELYIQLLVTDRTHAGRGIGSLLLEHARELARARGLGLLRVDCYRGDDRALVSYYERQGFTATDEFTVNRHTDPWPGQVLEQRLA